MVSCSKKEADTTAAGSADTAKATKAEAPAKPSKGKKVELTPINLEDLIGKDWIAGDWEITLSEAESEIRSESSNVKIQGADKEAKVVFGEDEDEMDLESFMDYLARAPEEFEDEAEYYKKSSRYASVVPEGEPVFKTNNKDIFSYNQQLTATKENGSSKFIRMSLDIIKKDSKSKKDKLVTLDSENIYGKKWLVGDWAITVETEESNKEVQTLKFTIKGNTADSEIECDEYFSATLGDLISDFKMLLEQTESSLKENGIVAEGDSGYVTNNKDLISHTKSYTETSEGNKNTKSASIIMKKVQ